MADDLVLKTVTVHPRHRTVLCPHCGAEGRNYRLDNKELLADGTEWPAECPDCGEYFIIHVSANSKRELPLRSLAFAIKELSKNWDAKEADLIVRVRNELSAVISGIPGMNQMTEKPRFKVQRSSESGNVELVPKNNEALRTMEIMDESKLTNKLGGRFLEGV